MSIQRKYKRRDFIRTSTIAGASLVALPYLQVLAASSKEIKVGIIGLDTSHSVAFTKLLNARPAQEEHGGVKVVAAFPAEGSDIETNVKRLPGFVAQMKGMGVKMVKSIEELLDTSDAILLESNDGRMRHDQMLKILKARKPVFMDKPVAASLTDVIRIYKAAEEYKVPVFSSSLMRYIVNFPDIQKQGPIQGAFTYSPAMIEKTHPDLFWYGIHGVEMLYKIMGVGCQTVSRTTTDGVDLVTGVWADGRIGTFRGIREGAKDFGGTVFTENKIISIEAPKGYAPLVSSIVSFFKTKVAPVPPSETIEIYAFMAAADESKRQGKAISLSEIIKSATG